MTVAYDRTMMAAKRAFYGWHTPKQDDAVQECMAKIWDSWSRLLVRGRDPAPMTSGLIKFAILWVRYDRKIGGRARNIASLITVRTMPPTNRRPRSRHSLRSIDAAKRWINWAIQWRQSRRSRLCSGNHWHHAQSVVRLLRRT